MRKARGVCVALIACVLAVGAATGARGAVSPRDFGAVGDGKTDDSNAFVQALGAAKGELVVREGRYLIKDVKIPDGTIVRGAGARSVIAMVPDSGAALFPGNDCVVSDLVFVGDASDKANAVKEGAVRLTSVSGVTLERLTFRDVPRAAVMTDHAEAFRVRQCRFENVGLAVLIVFSKQGMITENTVVDAKVHGMQFWGDWKHDPSQKVTDLVFANNTIKHGGNGAIWGMGGRRIVFSGNIIDGAGDIGIDPEWCDDVTIVGNSVRDCDNAGIALFVACQNVAVSGNSIVITEGKVGRRDGIWLTPVTPRYGFDKGHRLVTISGNSILAEGAAKRHGIFIGSGTNIVCTGNALENADIMDLTGALTDQSLIDELKESMTVIPLSQEWRFKTDAKDEGVTSGWEAADLDDSKWATVRSDMECGYEGQGFEGYTGYAWYRCVVPALPERMRTFAYLHFGAVDEQAWVYLNGELVGEHSEKSTGRDAGALWEEPFTVDVSKKLRMDGRNVVAVRTHNKALMGGIWRPVYLVTSDMPADEARQRDAIVLLAPKDGGK